MAVKRIWFPNNPSGTIDNLQRAQVGIGYPIVGGVAPVYTPNKPLIIDSSDNLYLIIGNITLPSWNTAGRPASARTGTTGFNTDTSKIEYYDGSIWN